MRVTRAAWGAVLLLMATEASAAPLCTTYTIKERVPRPFVFAIPKGGVGATFMLTASVDSQQGKIYCTRVPNDRADCRATNNPGDPVVVTLNLTSTDPDDMGAILAGFSAGNFSIGKGGWHLKCQPQQK